MAYTTDIRGWTAPTHRPRPAVVNPGQRCQVCGCPITSRFSRVCRTHQRNPTAHIMDYVVHLYVAGVSALNIQAHTGVPNQVLYRELAARNIQRTRPRGFPFICGGCGCQLPKNNNGHRKYCTKECRKETRARILAKLYQRGPCAFCGKEMVDRHDKKYCNHVCLRAAQQQRSDELNQIICKLRDCGLSVAQVGERLGMNVSTVSFHSRGWWAEKLIIIRQQEKYRPTRRRKKHAS